MKAQNYSNHVRSYAPHHFVFYPVVLLMMVFAIRKIMTVDGDNAIWWFVLALTFMLTFLAFMTRQHYALTLQNRLVRLELRQRYFELTGKSFEPLEEKLGFGRIAALRFASDRELLPLLERALSENLPAREIKKSIKDWKADHLRV
jgi:uncharacterized protein DUF6526